MEFKKISLMKLTVFCLVLTPILYLPNLPWKYPWDIKSYILNVLILPFAVPALYAFLRFEIFHIRENLIWKIVGFYYLVSVFPVRAASKFLLGELPPNWFSIFILIGLGLLWMKISGKIAGFFQTRQA